MVSLCVLTIEFYHLIEPKLTNRGYTRVFDPEKDVGPRHNGANILYNYMYYYRL